MKVTLFTTSGCHLCEEAEAMLRHLQQALNTDINIDIATVDIAESEKLMAKYGLRIPVIQASDGRELGWPFSIDELVSFLRASKHPGSGH